MLTAIEKQSYLLHTKALSVQGVDYLKSFSELDDYTVEAADGHFMDHAWHTEKDSHEKVYAAGFIYAMNLRNGLLKPLCCVTNGTKRHHEMPVLRRYLENTVRRHAIRLKISSMCTIKPLPMFAGGISEKRIINT